MDPPRGSCEGDDVNDVGPFSIFTCSVSPNNAVNGANMSTPHAGWLVFNLNICTEFHLLLDSVVHAAFTQTTCSAMLSVTEVGSVCDALKSETIAEVFQMQIWRDNTRFASWDTIRRTMNKLHVCNVRNDFGEYLPLLCYLSDTQSGSSPPYVSSGAPSSTAWNVLRVASDNGRPCFSSLR